MERTYKDRLAKFVGGGVSIVHVGGNTETEMNEKKKDRVDDALHATKQQLKKEYTWWWSALLGASIKLNIRKWKDFEFGANIS